MTLSSSVAFDFLPGFFLFIQLFNLLYNVENAFCYTIHFRFYGVSKLGEPRLKLHSQRPSETNGEK